MFNLYVWVGNASSEVHSTLSIQRNDRTKINKLLICGRERGKTWRTFANNLCLKDYIVWPGNQMALNSSLSFHKNPIFFSIYVSMQRVEFFTICGESNDFPINIRLNPGINTTPLSRCIMLDEIIMDIEKPHFKMFVVCWVNF